MVAQSNVATIPNRRGESSPASLESHLLFSNSLVVDWWPKIINGTNQRYSAIDALYGARMLSANDASIELFREIDFLIAIAWVHLGISQ